MTRLRNAAACAALVLTLGANVGAAQSPSPAPAIPAPPLPGGAPAAPTPDWLDKGLPPVAAQRPSAERVSDLIVLRDVVIDFGFGRLRVPHAEITRSPLTPAEIVALFDPSATTPPAERARIFRAERVDIASATLNVKLGVYEDETTYRDIRIDDAADGVLASIAVASIKSATKNDDHASEAVNYVVRGANVAGVLQLLFQATPASGPVVNLYDGFSVERSRFTSKDLSQNIRDSRGGGGRMAPTGRALADVARSFVDLDAGKADAKSLLPAFGAMREVLESFEIDSGRTESIQVRFGENMNELEMRGFWFGKVRKGRLSFGVENGSFGDESTSALLKGFELVDLDLHEMLVHIEALIGDPAHAADFNPFVFMPNFGRFSIGSVIGCKTPLTACDTDAAHFALEGFALERAPVADGLDWRLGITRLVAPKTAASEAVDGSFSGRVDYRREARTLALRDVNVRLKGFGEMSAALDFENVMPEIFTAPRSAMIFALTPLAARRAGLRLVDEGGVDKIAAKAAEKAKADAPATKPGAGPKGAKGKAPNAAAAKPLAPREALARQVERELAGLGDAPAATALASALAGFLRDSSTPLTVTVVAEPAIGAVNFLGLKDYRSLLLRLTTTSERR